MTNDVAVPEMISQALTRYSPTGAAIAQLADVCMRMRVAGEDDKENYLAIRSARLDVKAKRVNVEKIRKELKSDALAYSQAVDGEARRLTALLTPIEDHLQAQEDIVAKAAERRKKAEDAAALDLLRQRMAALADVGSHALPEDVRGMDDERFSEALSTATMLRDERVEAERVAAAERAAAERVAAEERAALAAQRAEVERVAAEERAAIQSERDEAARVDAAARAKLAEERAALQRERDEQQRQADILDAEERARREFVAEQRRVEAETARVEAMRPINIRLLKLSTDVELMEVPDFDRADEVKQILFDASLAIREIAGA